MEIIDNRVLLFRTRSPDKYQLLPKHKVFPVSGGYEVAVHWGLDEVRVLRNLGVKNVPSPIYGRYNWPGRYTPMAHQRETASFLTLNRRAFVLSEPGTGKTMSALWAADYLMQRGKIRRCLILCPLSIMHSAWMQDISNSIIHRTAVVAHHAQASRRIEIVQQDYEFVISNYEGVDLIAKELKNDGRFDLVIVDEANSYKNPQTKRWKALAYILAPHTWLWMMTGTPASQSPMDAYGLAKLVNPEGVPKFMTGWRDMVMNKITMFKWAAKPDAANKVFAALQPAIRYTKAQCMDLPPVVTLTREVPLTPQQAKYYNLLKTQMLVQAAGETITAVNAAAALNKLLQISCIAYNTPVLTNHGWVPIQTVRDDDLVWDGEEFVAHKGLLRRGRKQTVACYGVRMTPDHEVLTNEGWQPASACKGFDRADVRLPDCSATTRHERWEEHESAVAVPVYLWEHRCSGEPIPADPAPTSSATLRMSARQQNARAVEDARVSPVVKHATALPRYCRQRLASLWRAWHNGLFGLGRQFRGFLARHGAYLRTQPIAGAYRQQRPLFAGELSLGNGAGTSPQSPHLYLAGHAKRPHAVGGRSSGLRPAFSNAGCAFETVRMAVGKSTDDTREEDVYDIAACGPRNRFVVLGQDRQPLIVHNCGVAYTDDKETVEFDATPRLNVLLEAVEQTERKVIIFALFRAAIESISTFLKKHGIASEEIHGGVTATKRGDIIRRFQTQAEPSVLVMQPQAAAHGITLTAADTVIFYGPLMSVEQYTQAIARADRKGQDSDKVTVIHIQGSPVEKRMFQALASKVDDARLVVQMFEAEIKEGGLQKPKHAV